ncbi:MAG: threonine synthase [Bacteroidia bacterium]|jgi:threonine synthase
MHEGILRNTRTGAAILASEPYFISPEGDLLDLEFEPIFDLKAIARRKPNLWRYREAIPIALDENIVSVNEGFTPLLPLNFLGNQVWVKQEQLFSSGSYKDRGASVLMSKVKSLGIKHVVQDSSGNAGCAIAAYSAVAGISCEIFVPASTSSSKIRQIQAYGAKIQLIEGSREKTAEAARAASRSSYYASHCVNPYFFQGTKTFAYEICEQMDWKVPETLILPAGNGTLILGCFIGFNDLMRAGITDRVPKIIAIQAEACSPLLHAFNQTSMPAITPTLAEGIAIEHPVRMHQILDAVHSTQGFFIGVTESEIMESQRECGLHGFYIEPSAAATIAGVKRFLNGYSSASVVTLFSGHGLKK